jgi:hypothetical protein
MIPVEEATQVAVLTAGAPAAATPVAAEAVVSNQKRNDRELLHEAVDRTSILVDNLDRHVLQTDAVKDDPMLVDEGRQAFEALSAFYRSLGEKLLNPRGYRRTVRQWEIRLAEHRHSNGELP